MQKLPWDEILDFKATEKILSHGRISATISIQEHLRAIGRSYTGEAEAYYIELEGDVGGIFKPDEDPSAPWSSVAEVSMYQLSQRLGAKLVLPTVRRTIGGKTGSFQYYLKDTYDLVDDLEQKRLALSKLTPKRKADMVTLLFVAGQWDRHWGNLLIDHYGGLALIDNEAILSLQMIRYGEHPFVCRGFRDRGEPAPTTDFPFDTPRRLVNPTLQKLKRIFGPYTDAKKIERLHGKVDSFVDETLPYVIWNQALWLHLTKKGRPPLFTDTFSRQTMDNLEKFTISDWKSIFPNPFGTYHRELFFSRLRQIQAASKSAIWIP